ncbi:hypothetical protein ASG65_12660 [Bacillus sp. Leaf13]|nr:hypothetical protein ASG65_12660 [Bacillus sp. Leaf13]KRF67976.1 hypothetical protein ASG99_00405 [Bacillus sp. Soil768D1]
MLRNEIHNQSNCQIKRSEGIPINPPLPANVSIKDAEKLIISNNMIVLGITPFLFTCIISGLC